MEARFEMKHVKPESKSIARSQRNLSDRRFTRALGGPALQLRGRQLGLQRADSLQQRRLRLHLKKTESRNGYKGYMFTFE
jgi:hypothetical protein